MKIWFSKDIGLLMIKKIIALSIVSILVVSYLYLKLDNNVKSIDSYDIKSVDLVTETDIDLTSFDVIFVIKRTDFNCSSCLTSFQQLSDSLGEHNRSKQIQDRVIYLFMSERSNKKVDERLVRRWCKNNYINFKVELFEGESIFTKIGKSGVLLKNEDSYNVFNLPLRKMEITKVLQEIK